MTAPAHPSRKSTLRELASRLPKSPSSNNGDGHGHLPTSAYFGINTFGARQMRDKLPKDVYAKLVAAIAAVRAAAPQVLVGAEVADVVTGLH